MTEAEWKVLDRKTMSVIRLLLSRNVAFHTTKEKTTKGILKVLADMYEKPSAANKVHLMRRLFNLKMSESTAVAEHLNEFNLITVQLTSVAIDFDDELRGVRHIPDLKRNLISVGQLDDEGYDLSFGSSSWKIIKGAMVVARGKKEGTLYMTVNNHDNIALVSANSDADLWHCRLGHMSEKEMKQLCSKGKLPGLKIVELGLCEDCVFGKQKRVSFSKAGLKVKCLRSDNGGEYELDEFKEYCVVNSICMEKTVRRTPQQNGVAERMNKTLNNVLGACD
ncbi:hypothetical protein CRG98_023352 [Punica granatum]|uniref:Integrase catalytic domain-containing protein n=1 Tax=Punica granatum TaxID=22663 RepID=A0A2I0JK44_PUNGR|nr:hypothetical protein CRG98_023352 [Punica granatum]